MMKKYFHKKTRPTGNKAKPIGMVEKMTPTRITGWLLDEGRAEMLTLNIGGQSHTLSICRTERRDVAQTHGAQHLQAGFEAPVPEDLGQLLKQIDKNSPAICLQYGSVTLPFAQDARIISPVAGHLERCDAFLLEGWVAVDGRRPASLHLVCDGKEYPLKPIWQRREDAAETIGAEDVDIGFQAELPGYLWSGETGKPKTSISIAFKADGHLVGRPIQLSVERIRSWIEAICQVETADQYRLCCALEYAHYARLHSSLTATARQRLTALATRFNLNGYIEVADEALPQESTVPWHTRQLWAALRDLNARLTETTDADAFWRESMAIAEGLPRQVRTLFYDSITPSLCRLDRLDRLLTREDCDPERWLGWEHGTDAWSLSIALAAWSARRRFDKSTEILWRLPSHLHQGWINTECLDYAARHAMQGFITGRLTHAKIDKFIYAYLGMLNAFHGDWYSRLYDEALLQGALHFLEGMPHYADWLHGDLIRGLLKHYGLLPHFWQRLEPYAQHLAGDALWQQARQDAECIFAWLSDSAGPGEMTIVVSALRRFDRLGNRDARRFAREWTGPRMEDINRDVAHPGHRLLDFLLEEPTEGVRYAAFPLTQPSSLGERYPACGEVLFDTLRGLTQRQKDHAFVRHRRWGGRVAALAEDLRQDEKNAQAEVDILWQQWMAEATQGDALALDLAAWLTVHPASTQRVSDMTGRLLDQLAVLPAGKLPPPAPLVATLARLLPHLSGVYAEDVATLMAEKSGPGLLKLPLEQSCLLKQTPSTWPGDTLVVIYSCRKYLDSRVQTIRETWVQDLKARGIPYVILVGDGKDTVEGDVLALNVSDRYEDLPQKTLKLIDWVYEHTDFQYLYKIDDDCYLDVARFFENLSYRKHHYYGRVIRRGEGSMDRAWHQSKSHTEHARKTLDKSPEPSVYADGGGGWVLSRWAMRGLREARATETGQRLVAISLMEDKLVGDLLALQGISPSDEEYESYQRRRTFGAAVPVGMWENLFYPNAVTPTVMCHLDTDRDQAYVRQLQESRELWPKRLWPTCAPVRLDVQWAEHGALGSDQLELLLPPRKLAGMLSEASPLVVAVMRNEMILLPHFLAHYRRLGVGCFLIADNCSDDGTREYLLEQPDVALFSADTEYKHSHYGVAWQQALLGNFCFNRWVVLADADEFLIYPDCEERPLLDWLAEIESTGANAVRIGMVDMYPYGDLEEADFTQQAPFHAAPWFDAQPFKPWRLGLGYHGNELTTYNSALRHRIDPVAEPNAFLSMKTALVRYQPWMYFAKGLHYASGVDLAPQWAWFAHFKYHAGFKAKVETEVARAQHFEGAKEYRRYQAMLAEGKGRFGAEDVSIPYTSSADFQNLTQEVRNGQ
ncbi:glycosyltransferase family 2 protein [Ectothiorhodospira lacustris]|uniref:glycosyltransferase family 2 protein n=1 Tax=Ectothiorhodospira lacustris TaxID=2899127 RepID=UPI001EE98FFE|nr:glycosyltransferase family 2 protein [Ectothiorhodospira lacustris]MCG5500806.1 glycosyltransferase family 2 protein [Ectothiorhodospira lacustris]